MCVCVNTLHQINPPDWSKRKADSGEEASEKRRREMFTPPKVDGGTNTADNWKKEETVLRTKRRTLEEKARTYSATEGIWKMKRDDDTDDEGIST